jgi:Zn-dependent protease
MAIARPPRSLTVARVQAIEISLGWRWAPVLALGTWLLAQNVLPPRFPTWEWSTTWLTAVGAVVAGEVALLLHELAHALLARGHGQTVRQIIFHGFHAHTIVDPSGSAQAGQTLTALGGPAINVALAALAEGLRVVLQPQGPLDVFCLMLAVGNAAAAALSLVPLGESDGARALSGLRLASRTRDSRSAPG